MEKVDGYWVSENTEKRMINGRLSTITVMANRPSEKAIQRCADTMVRIAKQMEERQKRAGN